MKQCGSFKEYRKILRKYYKRHWRMRSPYFINIWLSYRIFSDEQAVEALRHKKACRGNIRLILNDLIKYKDKNLYWNGPMKYGILKGIEITNEDYYWIIEIDGKTAYESCVGGFEHEEGE